MLKTLTALMGPKRRREMLALLPAMLLASLLEMAGLAVVVSICASMVDSAWLHSVPALAWLRGALHLQSDAALMAALLLALTALYAFKLPFLAWENYQVAKFVHGTRHEVTARLCGRILQSPYLFFTKHTTAELQNLLGNDMFQLSNALNAWLQILMEGPIVLGMGACLLWVDAAMTLFVAGGLLCLVVLTRVVLARPVRKVSQRQREANRRRWKWLHHIVDGIKDIKAGRHEAFYEAHFAAANADYAHADALRQFWLKLPTLCIENILVLSVLFYLLYLVLTQRSLLDYLPGLSALAWTALRFLPAFSRLNTSLTQLGYARPSVEGVARMMAQAGPAPAAPGPAQAQPDMSKGIALRHVWYTYAGSEEPVLRNVSLEIPAGSSVGIVGPSGAGKTTLLDVLLGLLTPDRGEVLAGGAPVAQCQDAFLRAIAYVPQQTFLLDDTIRSNVAMGAAPGEADDARVWAALEQAALADKVRALPDGLDTQVGERGIRLSGGERQRLGLARAMYRDPAMIVFDEATSALDLETEASVLQAIARLRGAKTLVIVSHRMSAIAHCDAVYRVDGGAVVRESPRPDGA